MIYFADLHVHSKYSRATSRDSDLVNLAAWASIKGIKVVATGDFTHPAWRQEILDSLEEDGTGLLRFKKSFRYSENRAPSRYDLREVRFILNVEISSIYKKNGRVRKIHNLVFMPSVESMKIFCKKLESIGNLKSDGRPILGLDSRNLLEMALEASNESYIVPAHIWTPWFSLLGSKSGFNSVQECFEDLSEQIFALETGLSSDPDMNRRVSRLDDYTLISNSDTHSPSKLGREANIFTGQPTFNGIRDSIKRGGPGKKLLRNVSFPVTSIKSSPNFNEKQDAFLGTLEIFPEEGKYHWDGHRKCNVRLNPSETKLHNNLCPVCGRTLTVGVMNRVDELSDKQIPDESGKSAYFWKMIPLVEVISEALHVGPKSKKVLEVYMNMISQIGPELFILSVYQPDEIRGLAPDTVLEALEKVRSGDVILEPGYDGEFGRVKLFREEL